MSKQSEADQTMPLSGSGHASEHEAETRFRNMADHAPVMMWVTEPDGYCSYLNKRWYEFTGQTEEEALGLGWTAATHPDDQKLAEDTFLAAVAVQGPFRVEYRLRRADGVYRWAIDAAAPRFADDGSFLGHVGSVIDIDERREAEDKLALNEERLRLALEVAEIGQWHVDTDTGIIFWPPRVKAMFGISPDVPVTLADYSNGVHPDDREKTLAAYEAASDPRNRPLYDVEYRTIGREDGVVRWVAAKGRGLFDAEGTCYRMIGTAVDITSRKADELRLRELNESLEAQVAERTADRNRMWLLSTDLMLVTRFDATVTAVNPAWTTLLGWAESELVERRFIDLVHPEDVATTLHEVEKLSEGRTTMRFENRYRRKDGTYHWLSWTAVPGEGLIHAVARDISGEKEQAEALKLAEDALRQAQKMEAIGQLTGGVAHDFNNLLTVIRGSVDLLRRPNLTAERRDRYIAAIGDTADRAAKLTGQLLAFARRQALMPELFDVGQSILDVASMVRTLAGGVLN
ncbi:PAS domain-containing protein [Sphingomonas aerolata]|uniref:PAS domain-containing protein n=1 Tax=Sphingomonas aerolata TaxID=185951 RepID=UPI002FE07A8A